MNKPGYVKITRNVLNINWYFIIWMSHQIFIYSDKEMLILQLAKIILPTINPFTPYPLLLLEKTNWPINEVHISKLNWRQIYLVASPI